MRRCVLFALVLLGACRQDIAGPQLITRGTYTIESKPLGAPLGDVDAPYIAPSRIPSAATLTGVRLEVPIR